MIHYHQKLEEAHYKPEINEQWCYDGMDFVGKLYLAEYWTFDPSLGRLPFKYGSQKITFSSEEQAKRFIENPCPHLTLNENEK